jgi:glycosyltransferase involved in cell wall biosynthesis
LRIFGVGPEQTALQARVAARGLQGRIALLPPKQEIGSEYDRASILVHPSEFEGFGLSVAEAMAHGLPVIAFADCAGVNDLIEDNRSGLLVERSNDDRENVSCLVNALVQLAQDPDRRSQFGSNATAIAQRFDRVAIHDKWAQLLRDVRHPRAELE